MTWADFGNYIFNFVLIMVIGLFIISVIHDLGISDYRRRLCDWQEARINDLNQELRWTKEDLRWERSHRKSVERLLDERSDLLYSLLRKSDPESGGSAHIAA